MSAAATRVMIRLSLAAYWLLIGTMGIISHGSAVETGTVIGSGVGVGAAGSGLLIRAFSGLDLTIGLWALSGWQQRGCALVQLLTVSVYTLGLTIAAPEIWFDPFGRLAKNIPILVLIWLSWQQREPC